MNFLQALAILSFTFNFSLSSLQLCRKRPNEALDIEASEQRKKSRKDNLRYFQDFQKELATRYSKQQLNLLASLKEKVFSEPYWQEKKEAITDALALNIHPDDIILASSIKLNHGWGRYEKPLTCAVLLDDLPFAQRLLRLGADPNTNDGYLKASYLLPPSPILFAAKTPEMAQLLIAYKADVTCRNPVNETLLHSSNVRSPLTPELALLFFNAGVRADTISSGENPSTLLAALWNAPTLQSDTCTLLAILVKLGSPLDVQSNNSYINGKNYREIIEEWIQHEARFRVNRVKESRAMLNAIEQAKQEVEQARKEHNDHLAVILKKEIGVDRDCTSLILAYAQEHVLPKSIRRELEENAQQFPCEIDKLPNYDQEPIKQEQANIFWRMLGY